VVKPTNRRKSPDLVVFVFAVTRKEFVSASTALNSTGQLCRTTVNSGLLA
jgi:hypothetical protein